MATGKELKRLRGTVNMSAQAFANLIGVKVDRLRKWEERDNDPKEEDAKKVLDFFGINDITELAQVKSIPQNKGDWQLDTDDEKAMTETEALTLIKSLRSQASHGQEWQKIVMEMVKALLLNPDQVIEWKGKKMPLSSAPAEAVIERASSLASELLKLQKPE